MWSPQEHISNAEMSLTVSMDVEYHSKLRGLKTQPVFFFKVLHQDLTGNTHTHRPHTVTQRS